MRDLVIGSGSQEGVVEIEATDLTVEEWFALIQMQAAKPVTPGTEGEALAARIEASNLIGRLPSQAVALQKLMDGLESLEARGAVTIAREPSGEYKRDEEGNLDLRVHCRVVTRVGLARGPKSHLKDLRVGQRGTSLN